MLFLVVYVSVFLYLGDINIIKILRAFSNLYRCILTLISVLGSTSYLVYSAVVEVIIFNDLLFFDYLSSERFEGDTDGAERKSSYKSADRLSLY